MEKSEKLDLFSVKREARSSQVGTFRQRFGGLYLLGSLPAELDDEWSYSTDIRPIDSRDRPTAGALGGPPPVRAAVPAEPFLWRVEKSDRNPWRGRISVGRAVNNDLVLRHDSISKLHAHFLLGALARLGLSQGKELSLADAGSVNGTRVEGRRLPPDETVPVASGARIGFGDVECQLLDAEALHAILRAG